MIDCQTCSRPTELFLCADCQTQLADQLEQFDWLLEELDNRIACLDRITHGTIGRRRSADTLNPIDFDAVDLERRIHKTLHNWVITIATQFTGRTPTALHTTSTTDLAKWLHANTNHIARSHHAGRLHTDITRIVGSGADNTQGELLQAINPHEHHLVGPCPTITGREHDGTPRQCGHILFADTYDTTVTCPACSQDIDVEATRRDAAAARDLRTQDALLEVLSTISEPIDPERMDAWIKARRLRPAGYQHNGIITEYRIHPDAQPAYSLDRARRLRRRDQHLTTTRS